ncbi:hypothetical protein Tco_0568464 [Tanacetum coccineum]
MSILGSRYEVGESSTARPTRGRGIDYGFVSTVDAGERQQGIRECWVLVLGIPWEDPAEQCPNTHRNLREVNTRGQDLLSSMSMIHRTCMLYWRMLRIVGTEPDTAPACQCTFIREHNIQVHETRFQMQQAELAALRETDRRRQAQMVETLRVIRDMRREMSDMQAELLHCESSRGELDSQPKRQEFQMHTGYFLGKLTVTDRYLVI